MTEIGSEREVDSCQPATFPPLGTTAFAQGFCHSPEVGCESLAGPLAPPGGDESSAPLLSATSMSADGYCTPEQIASRPVHESSATGQTPATDDLERLQDAKREAPTREKMCSQCFATKTPMWRNDSNGNKTLCNACGVRLQRQVNKAKQQAAATSEPPTSLIAGKLPRSRTSPAKLSRADLGRSCSQESLPNFAPPLVTPGSRTLTLMHGPEGEHHLAVLPAAAAKRKQGDAAAPPPPELDTKRLCNDPPGWIPGFSTSSGSDGVPVELLVPSGPTWRRIPNCRVSIEIGSPGNPNAGLLQVVQSAGVKAATCSVPHTPAEPCFDLNLQGWIWDSPARWSILLATEEHCNLFKGLVSTLKRASSALPTGFNDVTASISRSASDARQMPRFGSGPPASYVATSEDLVFIDSVNDHIRNNLKTQELAEGESMGHKSLGSPLTQQCMERLIHTFDVIAIGRSQTLSKALVGALCEKTSWCPHRLIGLLVFEHWMTNIVPKRMGDLSNSRSCASSGASPRHPLSRSFSATSPPGSTTLGHMLSGGFEAPSGLDLDPISTPHQQKTSSETSDQSLGVLSGEGNCLPDSIGVAQNSSQLPLPMPQGSIQVSTPSQRNLAATSIFQAHAAVPVQWSAPPVVAGPHLPDTALQQPQEDEWEPLDPQTLAKIADPHQPRLSPAGEEHSDQTTSMMDTQKSLSPQVPDEMDTTPERQVAGVFDAVHNPFARGPATNLRRVVSLIQGPESIRSQSPGTPTSHVASRPLRYLSKHASIGEPGFGKPLFSTDYRQGPPFEAHDLAAVEQDNSLFFTDVLNFS